MKKPKRKYWNMELCALDQELECVIYEIELLAKNIIGGVKYHPLAHVAHDCKNTAKTLRTLLKNVRARGFEKKIAMTYKK